MAVVFRVLLMLHQFQADVSEICPSTTTGLRVSIVSTPHVEDVMRPTSVKLALMKMRR